MDVAKTKMDHKKSAELREQIWVLSDLMAGAKTDIPDDDLQRILENIPWLAKAEGDNIEASQKSAPSVISDDEKEVKKLKKRLAQIVKLKERQDQGEKLEANQIEKVNSEASLRQQLEEVMALMRI